MEKRPPAPSMSCRRPWGHFETSQEVRDDVTPRARALDRGYRSAQADLGRQRWGVHERGILLHVCSSPRLGLFRPPTDDGSGLGPGDLDGARTWTRTGAGSQARIHRPVRRGDLAARATDDPRVQRSRRFHDRVDLELDAVLWLDDRHLCRARRPARLLLDLDPGPLARRARSVRARRGERQGDPGVGRGRSGVGLRRS